MKDYKVPVTLDPDTAHRWLILSEEGRRVRRGNTALDVPDDPKRFTRYVSVLGSEGFSSGRHYWEVQLLREGTGWCVGVAKESVSRKEIVTQAPEGGVWAVKMHKGLYVALTDPFTRLSLSESPRKMGMYLDYEGGQLSLYNADTMEELYTYTSAGFTERVFPYLCLWIGSDLRLV